MRVLAGYVILRARLNGRQRNGRQSFGKPYDLAKPVDNSELFLHHYGSDSVFSQVAKYDRIKIVHYSSQPPPNRRLLRKNVAVTT